MGRVLWIGAVLVLSFSMVGCVSSRKRGWETSSGAVELSNKDLAKLRKEIDFNWNLRHVKENLLVALEKLEKYAASQPKNLDTLVQISRGYYLLADGHTDDMESKKKYWETGTSWGERAMAVNPKFYTQVIEKEGHPEDSLNELDKTYVGAIYWSAVNLGKWAKNSGLVTALRYKAQIKKMVQRVEELDSDFYFGAVPRYWGTYYAVVPGFAGGSMEKSFAEYEKSLKIANLYLATHVLFAENYAARKGDRELFKKHLNFVLKTDPRKLPQTESENIIEQKKAKKMLAEMESFF